MYIKPGTRFPASLCILLFVIILSACSKSKGDDEVQDEIGSCEAANPTGGLSFANGKYTYRSAGGVTITFGKSVPVNFKYSGYAGFDLEWWGSSANSPFVSGAHETLNGKHIKDRYGSARSIVFPDGTKFTLTSDGEAGETLTYSIFEGTQVHHLNSKCNTLELSTTDAAKARKLDAAEADGETSTIELTATGLLYVNIYAETVAGTRVLTRLPLGELIRNSPNQVNDLYDDPRLAATKSSTTH